MTDERVEVLTVRVARGSESLMVSRVHASNGDGHAWEVSASTRIYGRFADYDRAIDFAAAVGDYLVEHAALSRDLHLHTIEARDQLASRFAGRGNEVLF